MLKAYPADALEHHLPHFALPYRIALECVLNKPNRFGNRAANAEWDEMSEEHRNIYSLSMAYLMDFDKELCTMSDEEMKLRG